MLHKEFKKKQFWGSVLRLAVVFLLTGTALVILFYWMILPFEDFKNYLQTENALRKLLFIVAFSPIYGLLLTLFQHTIKKLK